MTCARGCGLCELTVPDVFAMRDDGFPHLKKDGKLLESDGPNNAVAVPPGLEDAVIEAVEGCPGQCIFLELSPRPSA